LLQTSNQPCRKKTVGALTSHYPIAVQRSLISENIKTTQYAINLLGKSDALEARDDYRNPRQNSYPHEASRRPQYNSPGNRTDTYRRDSIGVRYVQYVEVSNYDRQRAYGSPNRSDKRGRDDSGWVEQEGRRHSRRKHKDNLSLNPGARNFEPRTEDTTPNFQQQRAPIHDSSDCLNN